MKKVSVATLLILSLSLSYYGCKPEKMVEPEAVRADTTQVEELPLPRVDSLPPPPIPPPR